MPTEHSLGTDLQEGFGIPTTSACGRRPAYRPRGLGAGFVCSRSWVAMSDWRILAIPRYLQAPCVFQAPPREMNSRLHLV